LAFLNRPKVSKFLTVASGGPQKFRHLRKSEKFLGGTERLTSFFILTGKFYNLSQMKSFGDQEFFLFSQRSSPKRSRVIHSQECDVAMW
jgi:hypothetical protein